MIKKIFIIAVALMITSLCHAEVTYKIREEITQPAKEEITKSAEIKKYYADIYVNGNALVAGVEIADEKTAKATCESYISAYNTANKKSYSTIVNAEVVK